MTQIKRNWFALYTRSRSEFKVNELLKSQNIITYLPTKKTIKKWSDRKKEIETLLFSGYIFINATEKERLLALQQKHIVRCVSDAGKPAIIPDWEIDNIERMISISDNINVLDGLTKGREVEIKSGVFNGIKGILLNIENKKQLAVSIKILNRTVTTHLSVEDIVEVI
jgi:transcriptional antiterminator RfaH